MLGEKKLAGLNSEHHPVAGLLGAIILKQKSKRLLQKLRAIDELSKWCSAARTKSAQNARQRQTRGGRPICLSRGQLNLLVECEHPAWDGNATKHTVRLIRD